jgi:hypothetical protein
MSRVESIEIIFTLDVSEKNFSNGGCCCIAMGGVAAQQWGVLLGKAVCQQ